MTITSPFPAFAATFLDEYLTREPVSATGLGNHEHDGEWPDRSVGGEKDTRAWVEKKLALLRAMKPESLTRQEQVDRAILDNQLSYWLFSIDHLNEIAGNAMSTTGLVGDGLDPFVTREFAPLDARLQSLAERLDGVPAVLDAAQSRFHAGRAAHLTTATAIDQLKGLIGLVRDDIPKLADERPALAADVKAKAKRAELALTLYRRFLEAVLPACTGDERLGRDLYWKKLRFVLDDDVTPSHLATGARDLLDRTTLEMAASAEALWPSLFPGQSAPAHASVEARRAFIKTVLDELAKDHPTNETIMAEATKLLGDATSFVRDHDLVTLPTEPCRVIEMPEYRRGVSIAYCDAAGPLEPKAETFFAIAPTPSDWPAPRVASFYREYSRSMLTDLVVHEAMPGHFLQLMHNNRFPSKLRAIFGDGSFIEGWAVYSEWVMASHGFGGPRVALARQKMVLRLAVNALLDVGFHAGTMTETEALALMQDEAFQEEGEAVGKWKRARLGSTQLSTYYFGFTSMLALRKEAEKKPNFSEHAFHDRVLSFGSPPIKHLRALMEETQ